MAADDSGRPPLRGDAGASAGAQPRGRLGADRRQPGQAGRSEPAAAVEGEAAVRVVGSRSKRSPRSSAGLRADGRVRGGDRASTRRSCSRSSSATSTVTLGVVYVRRAYANGRLKHTKTRLSTRAVPLQAIARRGARSAPAIREPDSSSRTRAAAASTSASSAVATGSPLRRRPGSSRSRPLRPAAHLRDLRAARRRLGVRGLALHGLEHRDDRPPLRPPRPRQP